MGTVILVKYASRGRPERFFEGMDTIFLHSQFTEHIRVLVSADEDDATMNNHDFASRIAKYPNTLVVFGKSESKIHACNRDFDKIPEAWNDWQIVANFADDMRFTVYGWDTMIRLDFNNVFPDFDGYIAYKDPDTNGALSTLFIAGRKWYENFGFIYDRQFKSLFCDNLVEDCAKHLGKYHYTGYDIYKHLNPAYGHFTEDVMFREQQNLGWDVDQKLYFKIKSAGIANYLKQFNL